MMRTPRLLIGACCLSYAALALAAEPAQPEKKPAPARRAANPALAPITDDPKLPRVLLIGDSISIGYTLSVREALQGVANVHRIPTNGGPTTRGVEMMDAWLGDGHWDVIHFNWGLHDLKYVDDQGALIQETTRGRPQVPLANYEKNLEALVARMQKTGAKLIWCSTTPVPAGSAGRIPQDELKYNEAAARVMKKHNIPTDDLYTFAAARLDKIQLPANVHFSPKGSKVLAEQVAQSIRAALGK